MKKLVTTILFAAIVLAASSATASGDEMSLSKTGSASGGWSEERGYYTNVANADSFSIFASSEPKDHKATRLNKEVGSNLHSNLIAETWWSGVYHYSRARFENVWPLSGYIGDTGRVWDYDYTKAETGYVDALYAQARTYWGNE
ncbi:hypothetical protein [Paenibacillus sp. UMB4589-SE434]|uniref:hypothetical protein n=1 Tax=Paenibacillus sp. UMB4589-SE434 TaxID=3046314 RepID=UPI0025504582|nr:hypothetical protein [Paenibacillus sp. UMB4589-SE434]MDK8183456.1 hypothetical protein [Paenibacillus sp. UMB4589-SE434]